MRDFKKGSSDNLSRFGRDQRPRSEGSNENRYDGNRGEERRPRPQRDAADMDAKRNNERRSFNPNFSSSNRLRDGQERGNERWGERREGGERTERRSYGDKPYGERKSFGGERGERGERRSYGDKPYGERKSFGGDRPERKSYGDRPYGERKSFGGERGERKSYGDRPYGERKSFGGERGERKSYGDKPYGERKSFRRPEQGEGDNGSYPKYNPNKQSGEVRLNRYLAQSGLCSRREADDYITAGVVSVNGVIVTELGSKVQPTDEVKFNDSLVQGEKKVYLILNKPKGYVTSNDDPHADKTVMDLVRGACTERIYPVGRLDKNSVGLLLFTNDGDMTKQLTHPSHQKKKIYQVNLNKPLTRADMESIANGITLEDGEVHADEISYVKEDDKSVVGVEIHSGRNRIVRRIFEHLGYSVQKLDRVYYAGLTKKNLRRGEWRFLTSLEVERLKSGRYE